MQSSHKLYILVDKTLSKSQQTVQACHVSIEFAKEHPEWVHQSVIVLGVDGENELFSWRKKFQQNDLKWSAFYEAYWQDRFTAIACHNCDELVKDLELL